MALSKQMTSSLVPLDGAHVMLEKRKMLYFCSEDTLGLSRYHDVKKNAIKAILQYGVGISDSACAHAGLQEEIEMKCALALGTEAVLLLPSFFQVTYALFSSLLPPYSLILIDASMDADLIKSAEKSGKTVKTYRSLEELETLLTEGKKSQPAAIPTKIAVVTASIFQAEGNVCDLDAVSELAKTHAALLFVDDSHSFGILGKNGMGLSAHHKDVEIVFGTFSKGGGTCSSYIGCKTEVRDSLAHLCPATKERFLSPATLGTIESTLEFIPHMEGERKQLLQRAHWLRQQFHGLNLSTGRSSTHIIPVIFENEEEKEHMVRVLNEADILARPGHKALYFYINAHHSPEHLSKLLDAVRAFATH